MSRRNNVLTESDNEKMLKFSKSYVTSYDGGEDTIENTVALCPNCHRSVGKLKFKAIM